MKRVTGIGGIFFKCNNPQQMQEWYAKHLGIPMAADGSYGVFEWKEIGSEEADNALTVWSPFPNDTQYFSPSTKDFMFNYRVENLIKLLEVLQEEGVEIVGGPEEYDYGKFAWILDAEGNKIELWEPKG